MDTLYRTNLIVHVLSGLVGLCVMLIPLLTRKGARAHRRSGWVFLIAMAIVTVTGVDMALAWLLAPTQLRPHVSAEAVLVDASFLTLIGALTANALAQAIFGLRQKGRPCARPTTTVTVLLAFLGVTALASIGLGIWFGEALSLVFGVGALALLAQDLRFTFRAFPSPYAYLYQHINAIGTACISALTAFLVLGARRVLGADVLGSHAWLLWVLPALLLAPIFQAWIARYRRKLEPARQVCKETERVLVPHA